METKPSHEPRVTQLESDRNFCNIWEYPLIQEVLITLTPECGFVISLKWLFHALIMIHRGSIYNIKCSSGSWNLDV